MSRQTSIDTIDLLFGIPKQRLTSTGDHTRHTAGTTLAQEKIRKHQPEVQDEAASILLEIASATIHDASAAFL